MQKAEGECPNFANYYKNHVTAVQLYDEITDFVMLVQTGENTIPSDPKNILEALSYFRKDVFPKLCIVYRLLLVIAFSIITSCER